jgi:quinol monooxygenase YgiN
MIILTVNLRVPPDEVATLRPHIETVIKASRAEPGCIAYHYAEDFFTPGLFRVFEIYRDEDALKAHGASEHFKRWREISGHCPREERMLYDAALRGA